MEQQCIVCGAKSHRDDWINKYEVDGKSFVACDSHPEEECISAIEKALTPTPAAS
jgi:hypothetical protein